MPGWLGRMIGIILTYSFTVNMSTHATVLTMSRFYVSIALQNEGFECRIVKFYFLSILGDAGWLRRMI